jgi:hypothetical protein
MTKAKMIPLAALFTIALVSCNVFPDFSLRILEEDSFYAQDMTNRTYYKVKAEMRYEGEKCVIWAEKGSGVTERTAKEIADKYDMEIRQKIVDAFSKKDFTEKDESVTYHFDDMLDYANWRAGRNDKKLTVLLLDIKDGFKNPRTDTYIAGYFFSGNFYEKGKISGSEHYSNSRDMIYVDTDPGLKTETRQAYATFAHELQHLINYVTSVQMKRNSLMDTWVDEGLSSQAEYLYLGENPRDKCEWFSNDREGTIARGNNFFVWDNHTDKSSAIMDDYATVYLFFRWLYLQADMGLRSGIYYDIITNPDYRDYRAVTAMAGKINASWNNWENLLRTWLAANYYPGNMYGYTGDYYLQEGYGSVNPNYKGVRVNPIGGLAVSLYPGEGVYSIINDPVNHVGTAPISYAGLAGNVSAINVSPPYTEDVLLTFNANTNRTSGSETGYLTGVSPPVSRMAAGNTQTGTFTGPYVIDARDMLRRAGR